MSAKEMFEKLGYEEREETYSTQCIKSYVNKEHLSYIYFDYDKKIDIGSLIIDMKLLQAINKQVEELWGGINEYR